MKLTNTIRDAFVRAAMDDVPSIDYVEKIRSEAVKLSVAKLPPKVRAIYNDPALRHYVMSRYAYNPIGMSLPGPSPDDGDRSLEDALAPLVKAKEEQEAQRSTLKSRLRAVAYSVSTRKALADALPEFEKYLPADEAAALRTVPVIANVVSEFVQAGWPKGKKKAAKATA